MGLWRAILNTIDGKVDVVDGFHDVPSADSADNAQIRDVVGNKTDTDAGDSLYALGKLADKHINNIQKWFGLAGTPAAETHRADRVTLIVEPFVIDAGNDTWSAWFQILGSDDTPVIAGNSFFDLNTIVVVAHESNNETHVFQIASGESAGLAAKVTAEDFTEVLFVSGGGNTEAPPMRLHNVRVAAAQKVWIRLWAKDQNTSTVDFYIGLHEYS